MEQASSAVLVLDPSAGAADCDAVLAAATSLHPGASMARGDSWAVIALGDGNLAADLQRLEAMPPVSRVVEVKAPYRLASREVFGADTSVSARSEMRGDPSATGPEVGGSAPIAIMARCDAAAMGEERLHALAGEIRSVGASLLFVGEIGSETGMREVQEARDGSIVSLADAARVRAISEAEGLALCAEVSDYRRIREVSGVADVLQVGSRNMQDFNLLRELGHADRPVLLKRGSGATVEEFLLAAEYVLSHGNGRVILCESGIRTFDVAGKPRFEINAIPVIKQATHLPVIADPSQATSHGRLVPAVARAAVAAGADGLVLEVTDDEARERDGAAIGLPSLRALMAELDPIAQAVGRRM